MKPFTQLCLIRCKMHKDEIRFGCGCYFKEKKPQIIYLITGDLPIIVVACPNCFSSLAIQPDRVLQGFAKDA